MARLASTAVAGFFATPQHLVPLISEYFGPEGGDSSWSHITVVDPCAGEGAAILELCRLLPTKTDLCSCEMESGRHAILRDQVHKEMGYRSSEEALHGDAFQVEFTPKTASLLYLNPPYDLDPVCGRLEERFLKRFAPMLQDEGAALVFLVPHYALKASAETLAKDFSDLLCMRFPGSDFDSFKQVCLIARKVPTRLVPDDRIVAQVEAWAASAEDLPELGAPKATYILDHSYVSGARWVMREVDLIGLVRKAKPWSHSTRFGGQVLVPHILPDTPVQDLMFRTFPVATAPRPAHTASGIASGMFNGRRVMARRAGLPDLLVKGSFDREFVTIEEKCNKDGDVTSLVQVQQPKLVTTILDLSTRKYHTLGLGKSGSRNVAEFGIEDLLEHYGKSLLEVMQEQCPVTYDPRRDSEAQVLAPVSRKLFHAQEHASKAILSLLGGPNCKDRRYKAAILLGEIGAGKCLGLGTLVLKYDGTVIPVEEVREGDLLMGPDSFPRRVLGTTRGSGPLYRVIPVTGDSWVCNDAHILTLVHTMSDDIFDIPVSQYANSKRLTLRLSKQYQWARRQGKKSRNVPKGRNTHPVAEFKQFFPENGVQFPPTDPVLVDPYFYGLWYGDGSKSLSKQGKLAGVQITTVDQEIVDFLEQLAARYGLSLRKNGEPPKCPSYSFSTGRQKNPRKTNPILNELRELYGNGEHFPTNLLLGSKETRRAFLAGLLDSDGYLGRGVFDVIQKRREWAEDICFLARSLGIRATLWSEHKSAHRGTKGDLYWRVCLSGDFTKLPIRLPRKKATHRASTRKNKSGSDCGTRRAKHVNRTGIRVEAIGTGNYAGFELDGDGRFLLGDFTVTHNTTCALNVGKTIGSRMLTLCPPHLLQSWTDETREVLPEAEIRVLQDISDVDALQDVPQDKFLVAILSRETAKLSHGFEAVQGACPKCGARLPSGDLAKKRACCAHKPRLLLDSFAQAAYDLALKLAPYDPQDSQIRALLNSRHLRQCLSIYKKREEKPEWQPLSAEFLDPIIDQVAEKAFQSTDQYKKLLGYLLAANYRPDKIVKIARKYTEDTSWGRYEILRAMGSMLPQGSPERDELLAAIRQTSTYAYGGYYGQEAQREWDHTSFGYVGWENDLPIVDKDYPANSYKVAEAVLGSLLFLGHFAEGEKCGEPLYQAIPKPRRLALAKYIVRKHSNMFDFLVLDEAHEYQSDCSAQGISAHRLTELGIPTLLMTGSIMNGYAESLFTNMWAISRDFRREFDRDDKQKFIDRYGYRKRILSEKDRLTGEVLAFGSQTDRVERMARKGGDAPGVLPLFLFRHLLKFSVTLHKADLALELPQCRQIKCEIDADPSLLGSFKSLQQALLAQIRKDMYDKTGLSGKLFGALAELPSYLDRATEDTGNQEDGSYVIRYPESVGGQEVARGKSLPASQILAKEAWMLDTVERELAEGRNVMVYCWHVSLLPRLARLIEKRIGQKVPILYANKVATGKRQDWIDKQVVKKGRRVLVTNPVAIQTGLNNLVHFATEIWHENPACNPTIFRQAIGRIDRIGQNLETRVYFPVYRGTLQETLHELLLRKVAVATATDGLDNESVLLAAGASTEGYLTGLSIGRQLWCMLQEEC